MRSARPMLAITFGLASACRSTPAPVTEPLAATPTEPVDRLHRDCEAGVLDACDEYELQRALCLQLPEGPTCDRLRERGEIPPEPAPLAEAFGCRPTLGPIGPHVMICLDDEHLSVRYASGLWDQWRIEGRQREDTATRVVWVVSVKDGAALWITPVSSAEPAASLGGLGSSTRYHVVGEGGLLHVTLGARSGDAEDELRALPSVDEVCRSADACEHAIAAARREAPPPPPPGAWGEDGLEGEAEIEAEIGSGIEPSTLHTLRACHERWSAAAHDVLASGLEPAMPSECGTEQRIDGWPSVPIPPYPWPEPPAW